MDYKRLRENLIRHGLFICAVSSIVIVFTIVALILNYGYPDFSQWFATGFYASSWNSYIWPFIWGSLYVSLGGTALGLVIGIPCAIYMAEFANIRVRNILKPSLEVLNGFPSIIIGIIGLTLLVDQPELPHQLQGQGTILFAWIILGIMAIPLIASLAEDAIRSVPYELKEASLGLGATRWQTVTNVLVPDAMSGILTATLLAFGSGIGETIAVYYVVGQQTGSAPAFLFNPITRSNTLTVLMYMSKGDQGLVPGNPGTNLVFAIAIIVLIITAAINIIIRRLSSRNKKSGG